MHIGSKVDSIFLKRMKLKENDSIEFKIKYTIDKFGLLIPDSTKINTGIISFDNYMKMVVNTIPRFTPAKNENKENISYSIEFDGRFFISQSKMVPYEYVVDEFFFYNIDMVPIFPGCENEKDKRYLIKTCEVVIHTGNLGYKIRSKFPNCTEFKNSRC